MLRFTDEPATERPEDWKRPENMTAEEWANRPDRYTHRFELIRYKDVTGASGTGRVAVGVVFEDGIAVTHWLTDTRSTVVWHTENRKHAEETLQRIHGHGGSTEIRWY